MNIIEALEDPRFFKPLFRDPRTWKAWRVFLRALFALPIRAGADLELFRKSTGLDSPPHVPARTAFAICGRRSGKSFISSLIAAYLAVFRDWRPYLAAGERGYIFIIATDLAQAAVIKRYISGIFAASPALRRMIALETKEELKLKNAVTIAVKTASFRAVRGYTVLAAVLEELAFWRSEESANPDREIIRALSPALATVPESLLIGISTPYSKLGVLYEAYKSNFGKADAGALVWLAPSTVMNPTIDPAEVERALKEDEAAARAEWLAEWRADLESFVSGEVLDAVIIPGRFELPKAARVRYQAAIDPSGGRRDAFGLAIAHRDDGTGRVVLDVLRGKYPPFRPEAVVKEYADLLKAYEVREVESDKYGGEWIVEAFSKHGIKVVPAEVTASEAYLELLPAFMSGTVELLDNKLLRGQLIGLERKVRPAGRDLVTHYAGGHDDIANAAALALLRAAKKAKAGYYIGFSQKDGTAIFGIDEGSGFDSPEAWQRKSKL